MGRHDTRESAMKMIFQTMIQKDAISDQLQFFMEEHPLPPKEAAYFLRVVQGVLDHTEELDAHIAKHAIGWTVERMPKVDLSIMRLAIYEMLYCDDIPASVSINEAVELTKAYGDDQSKSFVNGVLAKVFLELPSQSEATS